MKKLFSYFFICLASFSGAQSVSDLFKQSDTRITWLGVDFSHVKLIGNFSEFADAGQKSTYQIRNNYFPGWNYLILDEPNKYDLKGMLRKGNLNYDLDIVSKLNANAALEDMETYNAPNYTTQDISNFVSQYSTAGKDGLGVVFIAEALNKNAVEAWFHFVVINMKTKEVLITQRLRSEPIGFGLKNYWAGAIYKTIKEIRDSRYHALKAEYGSK